MEHNNKKRKKNKDWLETAKQKKRAEDDMPKPLTHNKTTLTTSIINGYSEILCIVWLVIWM